MLQTYIIKLGLTVLLTTTGGSVAVYNPFQQTEVMNQASQHESNETLQAQIYALTSEMVLSSSIEHDEVQVFDVKQGHVIKSVESNKKIQKQTTHILNKIYEFAPEIQPDMTAKYIIRIPVKAGTDVTVNNTTIVINELFVFYYPDKEPLILVFDSQKHPYLFHTKHNLSSLLKVIQVE